MTVKPGTAGRGGRLCGRQGCSAFGGRLGRGTVVVDLKIVIISTVGYIGYIYNYIHIDVHIQCIYIYIIYIYIPIYIYVFYICMNLYMIIFQLRCKYDPYTTGDIPSNWLRWVRL